MNDIITTIKLGERDGLHLTFTALVEYNSPDWDFESEAERKKLLADIDRGNVVYFCAKVTASKNGIELGHDYLGGCCYDSYDDFLNDGGYIEDMKNIAIEEAKKTLDSLCAPCANS